MDLFAEQEHSARQRAAPLAVRMRPRTLDEFAGQEHVLHSGAPFRRLLEADRLTSVVFFGPPGVGKTTLAHLIAQRSSAAFETLHAAEATVKDVRAVSERAAGRLTRGQRTVLFLDEIHRFNKAQQDVLLRDVEDGAIVLIGATTENPFASVNAPLLSRSQVIEFQPLSDAELGVLLRSGLTDRERGLGRAVESFEPAALALIAEMADGDARRALNLLEQAAVVYADAPEPVRPEQVRALLDRKQIRHDLTGDSHYDVVSAFIKSMRGSDPDAALYWLVRMIEGGEDPRFIARRIAICASEDVGTADPQALLVASAAAQVVQFVGLPECAYALAHATVTVALAAKSSAVTEALAAAQHDVRHEPLQAVPMHLRYSGGPGAAATGRGAGYRYPHDDPAAAGQQYLLEPRTYYNPRSIGAETELGRRLAALRQRRSAGGTRST